MRLRPLGKTGLQVSEVGYGAWGIGGHLWIGAKDDESLRALHRAVDLGINLFDTALGYGMGHSEGLIGRLSRSGPRRCTSPPRSRPRTSCGRRSAVAGLEVLSRADIVECCEKSCATWP